VLSGAPTAGSIACSPFGSTTPIAAASVAYGVS
jgi:hypothetical protein